MKQPASAPDMATIISTTLRYCRPLEATETLSIKVHKKDTRRVYVLKVFLNEEDYLDEQKLRHLKVIPGSPFFSGLKFSFQRDYYHYLVSDFRPCGDLSCHLKQEGQFSGERSKFYIAELILALKCLHEKDIVYRSIRPEKVLLDAQGHIALYDFRLSKGGLASRERTRTICGTPEYMAPEMLLDGSGYTNLVDFWSLGILFFEMCCGQSPFHAEDVRQIYDNIAYGEFLAPPNTFSDAARSFLHGLLEKDPERRLGGEGGTEELKRHPFFVGTDWAALSMKIATPLFQPKLSSEADLFYFEARSMFE